MKIYTLSRYSTLSDEEPSLEFSFCSPVLVNKAGHPVYSPDYNENEELLLKKLSDGDYLIERNIYAKHPVCDLWRHYLVFDPQIVLTMPTRFSCNFSWQDALTTCSLNKTEQPIKLAVPRHVAQLDWKEILLKDLKNTKTPDEISRHFLGIDQDMESITYEISNLEVTDFSIFRLENDSRYLTFFSTDFMNWIFTLVPERDFFTVHEPLMR
jgi:hypothetical protein